jgi:hypothetical protein
MKGKKLDNNFIANFIINCSKSNIISKEDILNKAREEIELIDFQLKKILEIKKRRSKLVDVVESFKIKKDKTQDKLYLGFFGISNLNLAKMICDSLPFLIGESFGEDLTSKIGKELCDQKILKLQEINLVRDENFEYFMEFLEEHK